MTLLRYWNGTDYGYFQTDIMDLFEYGTQAQTKKFVKKVFALCEDRFEIYSQLVGQIIDKLSELRTLTDIMLESNAMKTEIKRIDTRIKRLEKAQALCEEVI